MYTTINKLINYKLHSQDMCIACMCVDPQPRSQASLGVGTRLNTLMHEMYQLYNYIFFHIIICYVHSPQDMCVACMCVAIMQPHSQASLGVGMRLNTLMHEMYQLYNYIFFHIIICYVHSPQDMCVACMCVAIMQLHSQTSLGLEMRLVRSP